MMQTQEHVSVFISSESDQLPEYKTEGSSGADLKAHLQEPIVLASGDIKLIPTGIFCEIPDGFEIQIRPRSGLALKHGVTVLNTPGTIDADYRGEIQVILINLGKEPFVIEDKMRIAQMVIAKVEKGHFIPKETLGETTRGAGGFGHTGVN